MKSILTRQIIFIILLYAGAKFIWDVFPVDFLPGLFGDVMNDFFGPSFLMGIVLYLLIYVLWRIPILDKIPQFLFCTKPNLQGTWKGIIKYRWNNKKIEKSVYLTIKQTNGFSVHIRLFTNERTSSSIFADIIPYNCEQQIIYIYRNEESPNNKEKNPSHEGLCQLNIVELSNSLEGIYYTDRKTFGRLVFYKRNRKVVKSYRNAQKLFDEKMDYHFT